MKMKWMSGRRNLLSRNIVLVYRDTLIPHECLYLPIRQQDSHQILTTTLTFKDRVSIALARAELDQNI